MAMKRDVKARSIALWTLLLLSTTTLCSTENVLEAMETNKDLSSFANYAKQNAVLKAVLETSTCTVFAPKNEAFEQFKFPENVRIESVMLHSTAILVTKDVFPKKVPSVMARSASLQLSKIEMDESNDIDAGDKSPKYFVNNAQIVEGPFEYKSSKDYNGKQQDQLLYIVDEVMYPYVGDPSAPKAGEMFDDLSYTNLKNFEGVQAFAAKIKDFDLRELYNRPGNNTFFIPVNVPAEHMKDIDDATIRGHIIQDQSLFTRTAGHRIYHSAAFNDTFKVELSMDSQNVSDSLRTVNSFVQSNTLTTSSLHHQGIAKVKVTMANVPVSNGVVHFIESPLMIISKTIREILDAKMYSFVSEMSRLLEKDQQILSLLENRGKVTLLAFTNDAFAKVSEKWKAMTAEEQMNILKLHIITDNIVNSEKARTDEVKKYMSLASPKEVFFNVYETGIKRVLSVEGGGVNATAIQADIGATNGIIHVIDRVLGIPFQTIREKLEEDSNIRTTYDVGSHGSINWSDQLGSPDQVFTLFAPSAKAWEYMSNTMPSEYKQLTTGMYPLNAHMILDRHLIVGKIFRAENLTENVELTTKRPSDITIKRNAANELLVVWEDIEAPISRSDVSAMNGVIHEIDRVLMKKRDLAVSPAVAITAGNGATTAIATTAPLLMLLLMKLF